ncbi:MAG: DUF2666 family protein [Candidatus Micrarchaeaceae archaeon]
MEEPEEYIDFMAKYKDWISVKRMQIREITKPEEIAFHLASINKTINGKVYKLIGIDTKILDEIANKLKNRRKIAALADAVKKVDEESTKKAIESACTAKTLEPIARSYLLNKILSNVGFNSELTPEILTKIYPETKLKLPAMRGRRAKKFA